MNIFVVAMTAWALAAEGAAGDEKAKSDKADKTAEAADVDAKVAKSFGGKVWLVAEPAPDVHGDELRVWVAARKPGGTVGGRKAKDGPWNVSFLGVFKKPSAKGPMTVQVLERGEVVDQGSLDNDVASHVFRGTFACEPDRGFNKGHKYVLKLGQIIKGKFVSYAQGDLTLE